MEGANFDKETLTENMRKLKEQMDELRDLDYEEIRERQRKREMEKLAEEELLFEEMRKKRDYPDCSEEGAAHVLWAVEYSDHTTCPGCREVINLNWEHISRGRRCPLCQQKLDIEFYIT